MTFADEVFGRLARRGYLRDLGRAEFLDRITELLADVNALHPFREGNGRTQRAFLAQLARDAGYRIRWAAMDPDVNVAASAAAHRGDNTLLRSMLGVLVEAPGEAASDAATSPPPRPRTPQE